MKRIFLAATCLLLALSQPTPARQAAQDEGVEVLLGRLEDVLRSGQTEGYLALLSATADRARAEAFAGGALGGGGVRAVVKERDRVPLVGTLPGDGYQLTVELLVETAERARLATWRLDVRRKGGTSNGEAWGIANQELLSSVHGLYRLSLNPRKQYVARNLVVTAEDLRLTLPEGSVFVSEVEGGATALVLIGRGEMIFSPAPVTERGQIRIFANAETLQTPFESVFLRLSPGSLSRFLDPARLEETDVDPREWRRAEDIFLQDLEKSFGVNLGDLSPGSWSLLPGAGDVLAEIRTRRFSTLTYVRSSSEIEDITLFDRGNRRNIALYSSRAHLERFGRSYSEEDRADYAVVDYDIEAAFNPARQSISGRAQLTLEVRASSLNSLTLRLAEPMQVHEVSSPEFGRLLALRVHNQNSVVVNLPGTVTRGYRIAVSITYSGVVPPQPIDREALSLGGPQWVIQEEEALPVPLEQSYLYSNRSYWYPQPSTPGYATARLRLTVPPGFGCAASGDLVTIVTPPAPRGSRSSHQYHFIAHQPARYFGWLITPLRDVRRERVDIGSAVEPFRHERGAGVYYDGVQLNVKAQPRLEKPARQYAKTTADIIKFYASLAGDAPYATVTLALVERNLPGGHSPPYLVVVAQPWAGSRLRYRDDPASFSDFPEFFLAHELAHQWWGQGVGWKNYHEQWISEGFAQYFAALFAGEARGPDVFGSVMRRMRRFAMEESHNGPIALGYRVGHIKGDSRIFRAVVYNKSALVLHMLRGLVGDDVFFAGVRRFHETWRFKKAGTEDFRAAMEEVAGRSLERFFERWIYEAALPQVAFTWREEASDDRREAVLRLEQAGELFDFPVQVSVVYTDRPATEVTLKVTERVTEARIPLVGRVRAVVANRNEMALVEIK
ncbi:MAG TPA: M1 family aminopeptidase [Vicinamibacterales bacterium]|nr:M1 family aminopeptidase [Vicinamibacterales bacterium]